MIGKLTPLPEHGLISNKKVHTLPCDHGAGLGGAAARHDEVAHGFEVSGDDVSDVRV
jgi:hypothetical protein